MATNAVPFPIHRVTRNPDIEAAREHVAHIRAVIATSEDWLVIELGRFMLDWYKRENVFDRQNDNIIPMRRS